MNTSAWTPVKVLITQMDESLLGEYLNVANQFRKNGIETEVYFRADKLAKQYKYADRMGIPFVVTIGASETQEGVINLKNMSSGEQTRLVLEDSIRKVIQTINEKER